MERFIRKLFGLTFSALLAVVMLFSLNCPLCQGHFELV